MAENELSPSVRAFLSERRFAVLATINPDGLPQQTVMWYALRGDTIVMNTEVSRVKGRNLLRDPRLSVCVSDGYRYVTIAGRARLDDDPQTAQNDIYHLAIRYNGDEVATRQMAEQFGKERRVSIYLQPERLIVNGL